MKFELNTLDEYTDDALLSELRRVASSLDGKRLTHERFDSLARVHSSTIRIRFGSWNAALDKAGISESIAPRFKGLSRETVFATIQKFVAENSGQSVTEQIIADRLGLHRGTITRRFGNWKQLLAEVGLEPVPLGRRYTEDECFENILALWTHYGRQPNFGELKHPPSTVGPKAYVRRWGGWRSALSAFEKRVNEQPPPSDNSSSPKPEPESGTLVPIASPAPRSISLALRYRVLVRDKFRCVICGASPAKDGGVELHVDHIYPWSRGGLNIEENLRTLCSKCNLGKGATVEASPDAGE